jgi:hypothetical protein
MTERQREKEEERDGRQKDQRDSVKEEGEKRDKRQKDQREIV